MDEILKALGTIGPILGGVGGMLWRMHAAAKKESKEQFDKLYEKLDDTNNRINEVKDRLGKHETDDAGRFGALEAILRERREDKLAHIGGTGD